MAVRITEVLRPRARDNLFFQNSNANESLEALVQIYTKSILALEKRLTVAI